MAAAVARAPNKYLSINELAKVYHKSPTTVREYIKQIDKDPRYRDAWVDLEPGASRRHININVWEDFLHFRAWLQDKNLRKHLAPYDPVEVARQRGE